MTTTRPEFRSPEARICAFVDTWVLEDYSVRCWGCMAIVGSVGCPCSREVSCRSLLPEKQP